MAEPVVVDFQVGGIAEIQAAFKTVDQILARFEAARKAGGDRAVKGARKEAAQVADAHVKATEKWMKLRERIIRNSSTMAGRIAVKEAADEKRISDKKIRDAQRAADKEVSIAQRKADAKVRAEEAAHRRMERGLETFAAKQQRILDQQARKQSAAAASARDKMNGSFGRVGGIVGGSLGRLGRGAINLGAGALALGGGFTLADAVKRATSAEAEAIAVSNDAFIPGHETAGRRVDKGALLRRAGEVQGQTNIEKTDLLKGLRSYVNLSSDLPGGMANLGAFAEIAKATGTDFGDLMTTAGTLRVQNKNLKPEQMMNMLRGIIGQGKKGAISMPELAQHAGTITATSGQYAGDQALNQQRLLGVAQLGRRVADPAEAATAVNKLATDIASNAEKMEKAGVTVRAPGGGLLPPSDLIANLMGATGGDIGALKKLGIDDRAMKLFNAALPTFQEGGGGAAGTEKVRAEIKELEGAGYTAGNVTDDFGRVMSASGERIEAASLRVKDALEGKAAKYLEQFADKLPELIPKVERMIDAFAKVADYLLDNPYKGIAGIITAVVVKDLALAGMSKAVEWAIVALLGRLQPPAAAGAARVASLAATPASLATGGGIAAAGGAVVGGALIGAGIGYAITEAVVGSNASDARDDAVTGAGVMTGAGGPVTEENLADKKKKQAALIADIKKQKDSRESQAELGEWVFGGVAALTGQGGAFDDAQKTAMDAQARSIKTSEEALTRLTTAIEKAEKALGGVKPPIANPGSENRGVPMVNRRDGGANEHPQ